MKIRPRKRKIGGRVYRDFVVDFGLVAAADGSRKRKVRAFPSREEAEIFLEEKKGVRRLHGDAAIALAPEVVRRLRSGCELPGLLSSRRRIFICRITGR